MSAHTVYRCYVTCDNCGKEQTAMSEDVITARITAAGSGWKFTQFRKRLKDPKTRWRGPRFWDSCPDCPLPETVEDAQEILDAKAEGDA